MESNQQEEVDHLLRENENSLGIGRSYECVFCKRGFNTAQALGGHMNIHRKDRARNKPHSLVVVNSDEHIIDQDPRFYHQIISPTSYQPHHHDYQYSSHHHRGLHPVQFINHGSSSSSSSSYYFQSASAASPAQPFFQNHHYLNNQRFNPFGLDQWSMSFNMPCGSSAHGEDIEKSRRGVGQEEELDLELRLGGP